MNEALEEISVTLIRKKREFISGNPGGVGYRMALFHCMSRQKLMLGPCVVKNKVKGEKACNKVTDTAREWVEKGYEAAGPFREPPLANFRANSLLAMLKG
jgi:hypothetical protein